MFSKPATLRNTRAGFPGAVREFAHYTGASGLALVIDFSLLVGLTEWAGWHYLVSSAVGFIAGSVFLYLTSIKMIFRERRYEDRKSEFALFVVIGILGLCLTQGLMASFVSIAGLAYPIAKIATVFFTFIFNFLMRKIFLFQTSWFAREAK
ncbi:MAG: hypothetical protein CMI63_06465 [Parvularcula sp.]|nr:hypothetical protein [Parvularcula sp.]